MKYFIVCSIIYIQVTQACRLAFYFGNTPIHAKEIFDIPEHSLSKQSIRPTFTPGLNDIHRNHEINLDGWGLGFFGTTGEENEISDDSCYSASSMDGDHCSLAQVCKSGEPAVDRNTSKVNGKLNAVLQKSNVLSKVMFGHVRAKSDGEVNRFNSHPFTWKGLLFMHNGGVNNFQIKKHRILDQLRPEVKRLIQGTTDSEHVFALFTNFLPKEKVFRDCFASEAEFKPITKSELIHAMQETIKVLDSTDPSVCEQRNPAASSLNIVVSTKDAFVATRYRNCRSENPPSLYISTGDHWENGRMVQKGTLRSVMLSSEPLSREDSDLNTWELVGKDELIAGSLENNTVDIVKFCLSPSCELTQQPFYTIPTMSNCVSTILFVLVALQARKKMNKVHFARSRLPRKIVVK